MVRNQLIKWRMIIPKQAKVLYWLENGDRTYIRSILSLDVNYQSRLFILNYFIENKDADIFWLESMIRIMRHDSLLLATLAESVIENMLPSLNKEALNDFIDQKKILEIRIKHYANRRYYNRHLLSRNKSLKLIDKSKMKRLEIVRNQLKRSIR